LVVACCAVLEDRLAPDLAREFVRRRPDCVCRFSLAKLATRFDGAFGVLRHKADEGDAQAFIASRSHALVAPDLQQRLMDHAEALNMTHDPLCAL
jgi:hypothetical protein